MTRSWFAVRVSRIIRKWRKAKQKGIRNARRWGWELWTKFAIGDEENGYRATVTLKTIWCSCVILYTVFGFSLNDKQISNRTSLRVVFRSVWIKSHPVRPNFPNVQLHNGGHRWWAESIFFFFSFVSFLGRLPRRWRGR